MASKQSSKEKDVANTTVARFGASLDYLPPGPDKISTNATQCEKQWVDQGAALVKRASDGSWWQAYGVNENQASFSVRLSKGTGGNGDKWTVPERKLIVGKNGGEERPERIIFGFVGGRFKSHDGYTAKVLDVDLEVDNPLCFFVQENLLSNENEAEEECDLQEFIDYFKPLEVPDETDWASFSPEGAGATVDMSMAPYFWELVSLTFHANKYKVQHVDADGLRTLLNSALSGARTVGPSLGELRNALKDAETHILTHKKALQTPLRNLVKMSTMGIDLGKGSWRQAGTAIKQWILEELPAIGKRSKSARASTSKSPREGTPTDSGVNDTGNKSGKSGMPFASESVEDEDPSESESSSHSDESEISEDELPPPSNGKRQKTARRTVRFADEEDEDVDNGGMGMAADQKLLLITPRGVSPLDAATRFFSEERLRTAASVDPVPANWMSMESDYIIRLQARYSMALVRMEDNPRVGKFLPEHRVASLSIMDMLAEEVYDRLSRDGIARVGSASGSPPVQTGAAMQSIVLSEEGGKRSAGLAAKDRRAAVLFPTAEKLQHGRVQLELVDKTKALGNPQTGVKETPAGLRIELQRGLLSSRTVHGPGMPQSQNWLPSVVSQWGEGVEAEVAQAFQKAAAGDQTQRWRISSEQARSLAAQWVYGVPTIGDLIKLDRSMRGDKAAPKDSLQELSQAWKIGLLGFEKLTEIVFELKDPGLQSITDTIDSSAHSQQLSANDCKEWVAAVLASWEDQAAAFRHGLRPTPPAFEEAVQENNKHLIFSAFVAAASRMMGSASHTTPPRNSTPSDPSAPNAPAKSKRALKREARARTAAAAGPPKPAAPVQPGKGAGGAQNAGGRGANVTKSVLWPDRPNFPAAKWKEVQDQCKSEFPEHCVFYLTGKCRHENGGCTFLHEKPPGFENFTAKHMA